MDADDRYDVAARDADFRARLQAAFEAAGGEGEAVDELWWRERAGLPHPGGLADPALARVALVESAYSRAQSEQDARHAAAALRAFESHRRRQTDALAEALARTPLRPLRHPDVASAASVPPASPGSAAAGGSVSFARRHRTLLGAAALVTAAAIGALAVSVPRSFAPTSPTDTPTAEVITPSTVLSRALARVQVPTDALPTALRGTVDPRSSRLLYDDDPEQGETGDRWRLWAGTGENPAQLCFVTTFDNVRNSETCLPRESALDDRIIVTDATSDGTFVALVDGGSVAVQIT